MKLYFELKLNLKFVNSKQIQQLCLKLEINKFSKNILDTNCVPRKKKKSSKKVTVTKQKSKRKEASYDSDESSYGEGYSDNEGK